MCVRPTWRDYATTHRRERMFMIDLFVDWRKFSCFAAANASSKRVNAIISDKFKTQHLSLSLCSRLIMYSVTVSDEDANCMNSSALANRSGSDTFSVRLDQSLKSLRGDTKCCACNFQHYTHEKDVCKSGANINKLVAETSSQLKFSTTTTTTTGIHLENFWPRTQPQPSVQLLVSSFVSPTNKRRVLLVVVVVVVVQLRKNFYRHIDNTNDEEIYDRRYLRFSLSLSRSRQRAR